MVWNIFYFIFPYIGKNHPNWLSYFSAGLYSLMFVIAATNASKSLSILALPPILVGSFVFSPTCQVRVVRFYQSCSPPPPPPHPPPPSPPPPPPRSPDPSGHSRTSTASARSQWALPDLHRELKIPVGTAGPQPQLPGRSGHCRTSTATSRSQWALPDLNRDLQIAVGTAGPQPRAPDPSGHCRTSTAR